MERYIACREPLDGGCAVIILDLALDIHRQRLFVDIGFARCSSCSNGIILACYRIPRERQRIIDINRACAVLPSGFGLFLRVYRRILACIPALHFEMYLALIL